MARSIIKKNIKYYIFLPLLFFISTVNCDIKISLPQDNNRIETNAEIDFQTNKIIITKPENGDVIVNNQVYIEWNNIQDAYYEVQINDKKDFNDIMINQKNILSNNYLIKNSLETGDYFIRIKAYDKNGEKTDWSDIIQFSLN